MQNIRILVVDDEERMRKLIGDFMLCRSIKDFANDANDFIFC